MRPFLEEGLQVSCQKMRILLCQMTPIFGLHCFTRLAWSVLNSHENRQSLQSRAIRNHDRFPGGYTSQQNNRSLF